MENLLQLKFLGTPEVILETQQVKFATRKALALFTFLVVETDSFSREKLMALFWPESDSHLAHAALRNTLARIKHALKGLQEPLCMEGDRVGFNSSIEFTLDLHLINNATDNLRSKSIGRSELVLLETAAQVSRGPFMDGFSLPDAPAFDEWLSLQRNLWTHHQNAVFETLSLLLLENHQIQVAIDTVKRWIDLDRLNENAYQRLMHLHYLNRDRSAALQAYETCHQLLETELAVAPSSETEELLARIRSSHPQGSVTNLKMDGLVPLKIPFVGRSKEYQDLLHSFSQVKIGEAQVAVITSLRGIGKTRLTEEFLNWVTLEGADILHGCALESGKRLPFQPVIDVLRERLEAENSPDDLLDDAWLVELTRIFPELRERYPDLPSDSCDRSTARARLFEAIARLTIALSIRKPIVFVMDDFQWIDKATLDLFSYLARYWQNSHARILFLILVREGNLRQESSFRSWMRGLVQEINPLHIPLAPIIREDIQQLIFSFSGNDAPGSLDFGDWLTAETGGNPLYLTEVMTSLEQSGVLIWRGEPPERKLDLLATLAGLKSTDIYSRASRLRDVTLSRLEWLSQSASAVLTAAVVIGRNCSFSQLCEVSGLPEQDCLEALEDLLSDRLVLEVRNDDFPYRISHDGICDAIRANMSQARRETFNRRVQNLLVGENTPFDEITYRAWTARE